MQELLEGSHNYLAFRYVIIQFAAWGQETKFREQTLDLNTSPAGLMVFSTIGVKTRDD